MGTELVGGQLWQQEDLPCCSCYIVYLGGDSWCRIPPPVGSEGCIVIQGPAPDYKTTFSGAELLLILKECNYTCKGQYRDVILSDWGQSLINAQIAVRREREE